MLIGGVGVFVGEAEADEDARNFEGVVHLGHEGNGAAFADENSFLAEAFFERGLSLRENRGVIRRGPRFTRAEHFEFAGYRFWKQHSDLFFNEFGNLVWILIRDQASGKFCEGFGGNHGLGTFALVATPDAIEFQSWANPQALHGCESGFTYVSGSANGFLEISFLPWQGVEGFAFGGRDFGDVIVKAGDESMEVLVVQLSEEFSQNRERIGDRATVHTRMQIARGPGQFDLVVV